jgi:hypothetical protein
MIAKLGVSRFTLAHVLNHADSSVTGSMIDTIPAREAPGTGAMGAVH